MHVYKSVRTYLPDKKGWVCEVSESVGNLGALLMNFIVKIKIILLLIAFFICVLAKKHEKYVKKIFVGVKLYY